MDNSERFNCAGESDSHPKCLFRIPEIGINVDGITQGEKKIRTVEDILDFLESARGAYPELDDIEILLGVPQIHICPAPLISDLSYELSRMFQFFRNGILPYPGGYFDQLSVFIQAAGILSNEESRLQKRDIVDGRRKK